jgi:hypothetical protein
MPDPSPRETISIPDPVTSARDPTGVHDPTAVHDPVAAVRGPDAPTLAAIAALAYVLSVALHEHLGHTAACVLLGSRPLEVGAFYVDCDAARLTGVGIRGVAVAGPLVSLLVGVLALAMLPRLAAPAVRCLTWLIGSMGLMTATGYLIFSGASGLGDLGLEADSLFHDVSHPVVLRLALFAIGVIGYRLAVRRAARAISASVPGSGAERIRAFSRITRIAYLSGAAVCLVIGALNPRGIIIVLESAAAASLGGTVGLLFMGRQLGPADAAAPSITFARQWGWIGAAALLVGMYAAVLGPTLKP